MSRLIFSSLLLSNHSNSVTCSRGRSEYHSSRHDVPDRWLACTYSHREWVSLSLCHYTDQPVACMLLSADSQQAWQNAKPPYSYLVDCRSYMLTSSHPPPTPCRILYQLSSENVRFFAQAFLPPLVWACFLSQAARQLLRKILTRKTSKGPIHNHVATAKVSPTYHKQQSRTPWLLFPMVKREREQ